MPIGHAFTPRGANGGTNYPLRSSQTQKKELANPGNARPASVYNALARILRPPRHVSLSCLASLYRCPTVGVAIGYFPPQEGRATRAQGREGVVCRVRARRAAVWGRGDVGKSALLLQSLGTQSLDGIRKIFADSKDCLCSCVL